MPLGACGEATGRTAAGCRGPSTMTGRGAIPADPHGPGHRPNKLRLPGSSTSCGRQDRFQAFVKALPTRARVSEPVLPLLLASLHAELRRPLLVLLPEDADARDAAEGRLLVCRRRACRTAPEPRGVGWDSGPHAAAAPRGGAATGRSTSSRLGGLICASALALGRVAASGRRPPGAAPSGSGTSPGSTGSRSTSRSGYERVDRVEERGQFAVRGGLVDVFPSTGREPLRVELFGDEIEQSARSRPFTQRALHSEDAAVVYPAGEHAATSTSRASGDEGEAPPSRSPATSSADRPARRTSSGSQTTCAAWEEEGLARSTLEGAARARPVPTRAGAPVRGAAARDRRPRARARPRTSSPGSCAREPRRRRVPAPGRGRAAGRPLRKVDAPLLEAGEPLAAEPGVRFASSPARRGFVWRELGLVLLPDTQVFRKLPPRADRRLGRALASFADLRSATTSSTRTTASGSSSASTRRTSPASRATTSTSRSGARTGSTSRTSSSGSSRATSAPTRRRPRSRSSAARRGRTSRRAPARPCASSRASCCSSTRSGSTRQGTAYDARERLARAARGVVPVPRDRGSGARDRGGQGGSRGAAPDGPARLRRRRLRQDRGRGPRGVRGRRQRRARCSCSARRRSSPSSTGTPSGSASATSRCASRWCPASAARRGEAGAARVRRGQGRRARRHAPRPLARRHPEGARARRSSTRSSGSASRQKELLRALRLEVDVLALSATPIPRTLHMSLSGLRDISIIETPPEGRRADPDDGRRVRRGAGQAGARARARARRARRSTSTTASRRSTRRPRSSGSSAPGCASSSPTARWRERELEERMHAFLAGDADVLVSTTIIESGIDIPQANTLIVERADALGLAQLYQIRGRVGRSDVTAHAYLFYPDASELTPEARAPARDARRPHRARRRASRSRCATSRSAAPATCSAPSSPATSPRSASSSTSRCSTRRSPSSPASPAPSRGRCGSTRASTPTSPPLRRVRGAQDRPPPPARARRARRRAPRAAGRDRGSLRAAAGAGREPLLDPGGEAEARAHRRRLPRLPGRSRHRRAPRSRLRRAAGPAAQRRHLVYAQAKRQEVSLRGRYSRGRWGSPML